jgi:DNA polymerase iota
MREIVSTHDALTFGEPKEIVLVRDARLVPGMGAAVLGGLLGGAGAPKGIGAKIWGLINGIDDTEVGKARYVPRQISIEDSYIRLDTFDEVKKELKMLAGSLIRRLRTDLTEEDTDVDIPTDEDAASFTEASRGKRRWLAHPRTLRLSTRPRPPLNPDGSRARCFNRMSRSLPMPTFVFSLTESVEILVDKLVSEVLIPTFRKMHPEKSGWNLSLVNVAATNMAEAATDERDGIGRDIGRMFRRQDSVLKEWKVDSRNTAPSEGNEEKHQELGPEDAPGLSDGVTRHEGSCETLHDWTGSEALIEPSQDCNTDEGLWDCEEIDSGSGDTCETCGALIPTFAMAAHLRYHTLPD